MNTMILEGILYGLWLLLPAIVFVILRIAKASRTVKIRSTMAAAFLTLPSYFGLVYLVAGIAWPPDLFFPADTARASVSIPRYEIVYGQQWGLDMYETYYEITREDGLKAYLEIDGDDNRCWNVNTQTVGAKVYFLCDESAITENTSYVDTKEGLLYAGGGWKCSRRIDDLPFRNYTGNPLVNREESGDNELYCR